MAAKSKRRMLPIKFKKRGPKPPIIELKLPKGFTGRKRRDLRAAGTAVAEYHAKLREKPAQQLAAIRNRDAERRAVITAKRKKVKPVFE